LGNLPLAPTRPIEKAILWKVLLPWDLELTRVLGNTKFLAEESNKGPCILGPVRYALRYRCVSLIVLMAIPGIMTNQLESPLKPIGRRMWAVHNDHTHLPHE